MDIEGNLKKSQMEKPPKSVGEFIENLGSRSGIKPEYINQISENDQFCLKNPETGIPDERITITPLSHSMFEEDISGMEREETIFKEEEYNEMLYDVCKELVIKIGCYIPQNKLQRIFPGLDIQHIESYDFSKSMIKLFVLTENDFQKVHDGIGSNNSDSIIGFTVGPTTKTPRFMIPFEADIVVNLSEKNLIIINEKNIEGRIIYKKDGKDFIDTKSIEDNKKQELKKMLKTATAHELIHLMEVGYGLSKALNEGITEWYAHQIINNWYDDHDVVTTETQGIIGYREITACLSILFNAAFESGVDPSVIDKAFISNDNKSRKEIYNYFFNRYGEDAAYYIWNLTFPNSKGSLLKYIVELESKQDSKMADFLKKYEATVY